MAMVKNAKDYATMLRRHRFKSRAEIELPLTWDGKETFSFTSEAAGDLLPEDQIYIRIKANHWKNKESCIVLIAEVSEKTAHQHGVANVSTVQAEVVASALNTTDYELLEAKTTWKKDRDAQLQKMQGVLKRFCTDLKFADAHVGFVFPVVHISIGAATFTPEDICRCIAHATNEDALMFAMHPLEYYRDVSMSPCDEERYCAPCLVVGGPGCGKTIFMIDVIDDSLRNERSVGFVAPSNVLRKEVNDLCLAWWMKLPHTERIKCQLIFLGDLDEAMDISALSPSVLNIPRPERDAGPVPRPQRTLLVVGCTRRLLTYSLEHNLHYDTVINDEFGLYTEDVVIGTSCLCKPGGRYYGVGDDQQCVPVFDDGVFKAAGLDESDDRYEAFVGLQRNPLVLYSTYKKGLSTGGKFESNYNHMDRLRKCLLPLIPVPGTDKFTASLMLNRRCHPQICTFASRYFYDGRMECLNEEKHSENEQVRVFLETKLSEMRHRVFMLDVGTTTAAHKGDKPQQRLTTSHVNDLEAQAVNAIIEVLEGLIPGDHILSLAAYKLQANGLKHGSSVQGAQGASRNVVLYSVCAYGGNKLSINGHIVNTAATRARSLFIVIADVQRLRNNLPGQTLAGYRPGDIAALKNLMEKVMPVQDFIDAIGRKDIAAINTHFEGSADKAPSSSGFWARKKRKLAERE